MLGIKFYPLDCDELLSYTRQDYYWQRSSHLNYFKEPYIPPLREELHVEENTFLEEYVEVKEENIEIFEEINEGLVIEEESKFKILEKINEDPIIEKNLEVEIVETIKEEIIEEVVNDLDEVKLDDCNVQTPIILVGDTETEFIDFIGVDRFDSNLYNYIKTKEKNSIWFVYSIDGLQVWKEDQGAQAFELFI